MVKWQLVYARPTLKDAKKLAAAGLKEKALGLLQILELNPHQTPRPYEKLTGDLTGAYSRRINIQHRLVYEVLEEEKVVKVIRLWSHYD
jgi:Txe/YoeB family toxin of toxin-antitoxin system